MACNNATNTDTDKKSDGGTHAADAAGHDDTKSTRKAIARKTIDDSQKDYRDPEAFLSKHPTHAQAQSDFSKKAMDMMSSSPDMDKGMSGDTDRQFAAVMILHHQKGIDVAREYLKSATAPETKKAAHSTIKSNEDGIKKLKAWPDKNKESEKAGR